MRVAAAFAFALIATSAGAEPAGVTSAYSKLDLDRCAIVDEGPQSIEWRCEGHGGVALFVQNGDDRYDVDAGLPDEDALWADMFDYPGDTVEWRLQSGRPFAIIYRLRSANPDFPKTSVLVVETVGSESKPGCRVAKIDGAALDANAAARKAADALLSTAFACLKPE